MNFLWNVWDGGYDVISKLREKYDITSLYVIQSETLQNGLEIASLQDITKERFRHLDVVRAQYNKYIYYNEMPPLDKELLDKMACYEPEEIKMLEREWEGKDSTERRFIQYHRHLRYWNYFLDKAKIDFFITGLTPHGGYSYTILRLCKIKGISVLQIEELPFQTCRRLIVYSDFELFDNNITNLIKTYQASSESIKMIELSADAQKEYDLFMGTDKQIVPVGGTPKGMLPVRLKLFKEIWRKNRNRALTVTTKYFARKINTTRLLHIYEKMAVKPDLNLPYIYFPLHYQPELTTSPRGGWFVHQYLAIEMLSYYVPESVQIYVKEHPVMKKSPVHTRSVMHYCAINRLKNVKLISLDVNTIPLIENAVAVASITGSVGYEAMFKKKPYLMFGNQIMKYAPGTFNIRNNADCKTAIDTIFRKNFSFKEKEIKIFLKVLEEISTDVIPKPAEDGWIRSKQNINVISNMFERAIDMELVKRCEKTINE